MKNIIMRNLSASVPALSPVRVAHPAFFSSVFRTFKLLLLLAILPVATANATYWYVDSSVTGTHNGQTWATAWSSISSISGVKAGDIVYISGGPSGSSQTYSMSGSWSPAGGSAGSPITYQIGQDSLHNGTAIFSGSGTFLGPASYAVISGDAGDGNMHFAISSGYSSGANVNGTTGMRIAYINFGSNMGDGVEGQSITQFEYDHNYTKIAGTAVDHFLSCGFSDPSFDGSRIHDNTVYVPKQANAANGCDAFQISGSGFSLYNNLISGYAVAWTGGGMQHEDGIQTLVGSYMKIYGNTFQDLANSCIFMDGYYGAFAHIYIYNNVFQITSAADNNSPGAVEIGADGGPAVPPSFTDIIVDNNTFVDINGGNAIAFGNCPACNGGNSSPYTGCYAYNNVLVNSGGVLTYSSPVTTGNNVILTSAQGASIFTSYKTDSAANDYHLTSAATALIKTGANESSYFTTDKSGNARPASGAWDIGAYIYGSTGSGPSLTISPISTSASDVDPNTAGLQVYEGTTVQFTGAATYTGTNTLNWQWSYAVNGGSTVVYQSGTGTVPGVSFNFATGTGGNTYVWTLQATAGTNSAVSSLTMSVEVPPAPNTTLTFQAPSGIITAPFTVTGNYISQSITTTTISATGEAAYNFTITNAGNYVIQALVNAPSDSANSFYVNIDAQPVDPTMAWDVFPLTTGFQNELVSWRGTGSDTNNQFIPKIFSLTAGAHQIIFAGREAGTQLESFSLLELPATPQNLRILPTVVGNAPNFSAGP